MSAEKTAVIGAGISGLSVAYWLDRAGLDVSVWEGSSHVGGSIVTERQGDFLVDLGPNSTLETSSTLKDLIRDIGLEEEKVYANDAASNRYVVKHGTLHPIPMSPVKFLTTKLFSASAKLRLLKEPFLKPTTEDDISLADFVRYRLGKEFLEYAINPFVACVYAGDPETLSTVAAFPKLYALEQTYGSLIKGAIKGARERKKRNEVAKDRAKLFSFKNGMQTLTDTLAAHLKGKINTETSVLSLKKDESGFMLEIKKGNNLQTLVFDRVVLSVPTYALAHLVKDLAPDNTVALSNINYPPVAVVFSAFKRHQVKRELDGFGFLIPAVEKKNILGSIWSSTIFPGRAPKNMAAFTTFMGGTRQPDHVALDDAQLGQMVYDDLNAIVGLSGPPVFTRIKKWERAIPQYALGYKHIQDSFTEMEEKIRGLYFAGNFRRGISVGDSVLCARDTVDKILNITTSL